MELCVMCGGKVIEDIREQTFTRKDKTIIKIKIKGFFCLECNEGYFSSDNLKELDELMKKSK